MDLFKDVEQGIPEERDQLDPLLSIIAVNDVNGRLRPSRALNLPPINAQNLAISEESCYDETPSAGSTANNDTPVPEVLDSWYAKWLRGNWRLRRLNSELLEAIESHDVEEVERLLNAGANPNATCRLGFVSACHFGALAGGNSLALLLQFGAEKNRQDKLGRTPLHLAAWAGNARQVAILLDFPEDMLDRVDDDSMTSEVEEGVRKFCEKTRELANIRSGDLSEVVNLPKNWEDSIDHGCKDISGTIPVLQPGWTPLHVASSCARLHCVRLLLAAGADPNICDVQGRTPLDVTGSAFYFNETINAGFFTEIIKMLLRAGGKFNTMKRGGINNLDTPLHTAVELESLEAIDELLNAGVSNACLNVAGLTPPHVCVKRKLKDPLQILANYGTNYADSLATMVDVKDKDGHTVLQAAVKASWVTGVCTALEAGADVTLKANDGETPIHSAAALGNIHVLNEILSVAKQRDFIDCQNDEGETPLFKAIINGHLECLRALLSEGASMKVTLRRDANVFHIAAEHGQFEILQELLAYDEDITNHLINALTDSNKCGFGPIHFAVSGNHIDCVELLISKNADLRLRTTKYPHNNSTPLHIAAVKNYVEIAKLILKFDNTTIHEVNSMGWFPLHSAAHHGSTDVITTLLQEGADLSGYTDGPRKYRKTALDLIIHNMSKPTEFLEEVFDSYIETNSQNLPDSDCVITVDYRVLMPTSCEMEQMKVIQTLIKTGNRFGQRKLLIHPLVESFLYLKWKALVPFFYTIIFFYSLFVGTLTTFAVSVFFFKDTKEEPPEWLDPHIWGYTLYGTIFLLLLQELLYMNVKSSRYFLQLETWVKIGSIGLATILPPAILINSWSLNEWPRHVATLALLLSWIELMFLLSRFPNWGYYVLMFGKVSSNVVKILLTFAFFVIGFSLSFMIQFRSQIPFEGPWAALVKTMVMMTSEFDYVALFDEEHSKELGTSLIIIRLIFVIFLILAAIVLMNLMVGVAVNDINDLEVLGNIRRLAKQVQFLGTLDTLVYNGVFNNILLKKIDESIKNKRKVMRVLSLNPLNPGQPRWKRYNVLPKRLKDAIIDKALRQKKEMEDELGVQNFRTKLDEMHQAIVKPDEQKLQENKMIEDQKVDKMRYEFVIKHLNDIDDGMDDMKKQMKNYVEETKSPLEELNVKMDQMSIEMEAIKQFLSRLESKKLEL